VTLELAVLLFVLAELAVGLYCLNRSEELLFAVFRAVAIFLVIFVIAIAIHGSICMAWIDLCPNWGPT